jgi:hypothetical protein
MDPNIPEIVAEFAAVGIGSLAALSCIGVGIHAYLRRMRRKDSYVPAARYDEDRLARIEQAVDAIAIEVERVAESQRFLTRLQTARDGELRPEVRSAGGRSDQTERTDERVLKS